MAVGNSGKLKAKLKPRKRLGLRAADVRMIAKALHIQDGDIILIKAGTLMAQKENFNKLAHGLADRGYPNCVLITVESLDFDFSVLNEDQMKQLGWQKIKKRGRKKKGGSQCN